MPKTTDPTVVRATPCAKCPFRARFRGADDYLRSGRRESIVRSLLEGADFPCHETTVESDEDDENGFSEMVRTPDSSSCAGAWLVMLRAEHAPQMARISAQLGMVDLDELLDRNADVDLFTFDELTERDEDVEPCEIVNPGCLAPAGYMSGGVVVHGAESADDECSGCGRPVCSNCMDDAEVCPGCLDELE